MTTLAEALPAEIDRVRELIPLYESVPLGYLAASMMRGTIKAAEQAIMQGDVVEMLSLYEQLKGFKA